MPGRGEPPFCRRVTFAGTVRSLGGLSPWRAGRLGRTRYQVLGTLVGPPRIDGCPGAARRDPATRRPTRRQPQLPAAAQLRARRKEERKDEPSGRRPWAWMVRARRTKTTKKPDGA